MAMSDASVRLFNYEMSNAVVLALSTPNGGEPVSPP